ncbi:alanine--tRNA ligase [Salinarchaeum laminariae]|uniref:alanine--tRNA ligase n=1 Tax=Salinarchaeum laminariae TaxID=869888 RepID=UPI0020BFEEA8|nr:alanine--tRNA ligase [Salinarchaeum laminariae]
MSDLEEEYRLEFFDQEGFVRRECVECGAHFWTRDEDRETCGEPPCETYTFIDDPGFAEEYTLEEMREAFLSYFEEHDHERIEPYPVAANRWRDDVLLTQASIYDFQPLVTSGETPPPANPLTISQPCIRMQDIDNVGTTGRHTMAFEMMAHHAFNAREDIEDAEQYAYEGEVYWKDRTVELCEGFFESLGADVEGITYIEDPWVGGGNAGPAIEVIYEGAELATLVFMSMEQDPEGEYELKDGNRYSKMDTYVVDTGYGLERWTWVSQGTPTVYEAIYPDQIAFLKDNAGIELTEDEQRIVHDAAALAGNMDIDEAEDLEAARDEIAAEIGVDVADLEALVEPLESIYAIADHCRTLAYMLGDEIVPSNVGTGYLARMVLRRTKRLVDEVGVDAPLDELVDMQAERLGYENRDHVRDVVRTEVEKYRETLERGRRRVEDMAAEHADAGEPIPTPELVELYDSHGIQPDMVEDIAAEHGADVDVPEDFYGQVASRHDEDAGGITAADADERFADLPATEQLYYDDQQGTEFEAVVLDVFEREDGYDVVLDQTMFYPEGGGQPPDHGTLTSDDATVEVTDVQIEDGVIRHRTDEELDKGSMVRGKLDVDRRRQLMRNHTATHVVIHAARRILGDHVRQAGAQKGVDSSRIDVAHYDRIDREQVRQIERLANEIVMANVSVSQEWLHRNDAEAEYGFDLYQGGVPPGEQIRIIQVDADVQACGGTHVARTGDIGAIKVRSTERVQDGVERLTFSAGTAAIEATQRTEDALYDTAAALDVDVWDVPDTATRFFDEWKERGKRIEELQEELAEARAAGGDDDATEVEVGETTAVVRRIDAEMDELRATANALVEDGQIAVLGSGGPASDVSGTSSDSSDGTNGAQFVVGVPEGCAVNAGEVVSQLASRVGGGGGGPPDFAQGGGPDADQLDDALADAPEILQAVVDA